MENLSTENSSFSFDDKNLNDFKSTTEKKYFTFASHKENPPRCQFNCSHYFLIIL